MRKLKSSIDFLKSVKDELKRAYFPSRKEVITVTVGVISFSIFMAIYLGILDFLFSRLISKILTF